MPLTAEKEIFLFRFLKIQNLYFFMFEQLTPIILLWGSPLQKADKRLKWTPFKLLTVLLFLPNVFCLFFIIIKTLLPSAKYLTLYFAVLLKSESIFFEVYQSEMVRRRVWNIWVSFIFYETVLQLLQTVWWITLTRITLTQGPGLMQVAEGDTGIWGEEQAAILGRGT